MGLQVAHREAGRIHACCYWHFRAASQASDDYTFAAAACIELCVLMVLVQSYQAYMNSAVQ